MSAATGTVAVCAALGDETRWSLLLRLGSAPASASALAAELPITRQAVAQHLAVLAEVGLVTSERRGREVVYSAIGARLGATARELEAAAIAWDRSLAALKRAAETPAEP